jgi:hypothetical protein
MQMTASTTINNVSTISAPPKLYCYILSQALSD